jgi:hypothetical protein
MDALHFSNGSDVFSINDMFYGSHCSNENSVKSCGIYFVWIKIRHNYALYVTFYIIYDSVKINTADLLFVLKFR